MSQPMLTGHLAQEHRTIAKMLTIYCQAHCVQADNVQEKHPQGYCTSCQDLLNYAAQKLDRCPYGQAKPTCAKCPIHCYKPEPKSQIRLVMRYAGPRMLFHHPIAALQHLFASHRRVATKPSMQSNRQRNAQKNQTKRQ